MSFDQPLKENNLEKPSSKLVNAITVAIFSNKVENWPSYDPDIPAPFCDEEGIKKILKAIQAHSGTKLGEYMEFKDEITEERKNDFYYEDEFSGKRTNFDCRISNNLWHNPSGGHIYLEENPDRIATAEKNQELIMAFMMNVPSSMFLKRTGFGNAQGNLLWLRDQIKNGKEYEVETQANEKGFSRFIPINVDNNCAGVFAEVNDKSNPLKHPMFAVIFGARFKGELNDQDNLMQEIKEIVLNNFSNRELEVLENLPKPELYTEEEIKNLIQEDEDVAFTIAKKISEYIYKSKESEEKVINSLPEGYRNILATWDTDANISGNSFQGYYREGSAEKYQNLAIDAYEKIGAKEISELLKKVFEEIKNKSKTFKENYQAIGITDAFDKACNRGEITFDDFESEYKEFLDIMDKKAPQGVDAQDRFFKFLNEYVKNNIKDFI